MVLHRQLVEQREDAQVAGRPGVGGSGTDQRIPLLCICSLQLEPSASETEKVRGERRLAFSDGHAGFSAECVVQASSRLTQGLEYTELSACFHS